METLQTTRYRIELIQEWHYDHLKAYALDEKLWKFSTVKIKTEADFKKYFNQALRFTKQTSQHAFVVYDLVNNEYVGMTRLYAFDSKNKSTKLGFTWYKTEAQGSGINTHVKYLILQFAFEVLHIERVELNADARNTRSIAAMKKIGAFQEGLLRQNIYLPDGFKRDTVIFSILRHDWENSVGADLAQQVHA